MFKLMEASTALSAADHASAQVKLVTKAIAETIKRLMVAPKAKLPLLRNANESPERPDA